MQESERVVLIAVIGFAVSLACLMSLLLIPGLAWGLFLWVALPILLLLFGTAVIYVGILSYPAITKYVRDRREAIRLDKLVEAELQRSGMLDEPWRDYRGEQLEEFVCRVFRQNGFDAKVTKASGDQGVDVIVKRNKTQMGIQVKGYTGSVSNTAVQEVVAGLKFWDCQLACVITNSTFTASAHALARANSVEMIDGSEFSTLIDGRHSIYSHLAHVASEQ